MKVVLIGLDGFPNRMVRPELTPRLWQLAQSGRRASDGARTALPSSTDPGFCTLLTGRLPSAHGVRTTAWRFAQLPKWAGEQRPVVPTIFSSFRKAGIKTAAVMSDDRGLLCTSNADVRWPADDRVPDGIPTDAYGYPANSAVLEHLLPVLADRAYPFVFGHMNESDTAGHEDGPESEAAVACYRGTDSDVGKILDALEPVWQETIVIVVSDHDMDTPRQPAIDLTESKEVRDLIDGVIPDGGAALVHLRGDNPPAQAVRALSAVDGVVTVEPMSEDVLIAGAGEGRRFSSPAAHPGGFHGGPATARSVAIVGGGHRLVKRIGLDGQRPHLADWAPTIGEIFGFSVESDGRSLLT